jgi:mono/diheme cytochrome c family protein
MKTLLKILAVVVGLFVICVIAGLAFLYTRYPNVPAAENITIQATPERLARGEYLANHVTGCLGCHTERDFTKYGGPFKPETRGQGGELFGEVGSGFEVYARNITPAAIGDWSDGEVLRAMTAGVAKDGSPLFPVMPYPKYARLSREDAESIVAYIRTLKPITHSVPERKLPFPLPFIVRTMPTAPQFRAVPPKTDRVAYGEYLTNAAVCADCHTPTDDQGQPLPGRDFAGGQEFKLPNGAVVRPANITGDADTGIGTWTEQQFIEKFKTWQNTEPKTLSAAEQRENTIMPWTFYAGMTNDDLAAIYSYLRSLKPVINRVKKFN